MNIQLCVYGEAVPVFRFYLKKGWNFIWDPDLDRQSLDAYFPDPAKRWVQIRPVPDSQH
jgi:hypothetical protein